MRRALVLVGLLVAAPAFAYEAVPLRSFAKPTANRKYVLVMLLGGPRDVELKKKYAASGLYPADDPTKPVWTCDWTANWERNVFASDDGVYAVRVLDRDPGGRTWALMDEERPIPPKKPGWDTEAALLVYQNGKLVRTLAIKDVFDPARFSDRDCFMGPIVTLDAFEDVAGRVNVSAEAKGKKLTATVAFRTGEVVTRTESRAHADDGNDTDPDGESERGWGRPVLIGVLVVGLCTAAFVGLAVLVVRHQRKRAE
jgi:hypothetical protein